MAAFRAVQLGIGDEVHAQGNEFLRIGTHEDVAQQLLRLRPHPHGGGVQVHQLGDEEIIGEDVRFRQVFRDGGEDTQPAAELWHRQDYRAADGKRIADFLDQRGDLHFADVAAAAGAVVTVEHGEVGGLVFDRVKGVDTGAAVVIAGKEDGALAFAHTQPHAARAVPAAPPGNKEPAGEGCFAVWHAQPFQDDGIDHGKGQLAGGFRRHHDAAGEAVVNQVFQRAGLVFMRMADKQVLRGADMLRADMRELVPGVAALVTAVDDEGRSFALHDIAMPLLVAGVSGEIELHAKGPPCRLMEKV